MQSFRKFFPAEPPARLRNHKPLPCSHLFAGGLLGSSPFLPGAEVWEGRGSPPRRSKPPVFRASKPHLWKTRGHSSILRLTSPRFSARRSPLQAPPSSGLLCVPPLSTSRCPPQPHCLLRLPAWGRRGGGPVQNTLGWTGRKPAPAWACSACIILPGA